MVFNRKTDKIIEKLFGYQSADPPIYLITTKYGNTINGQIATDVIGLTFLMKWPRVILFLGKDKYTAELVDQSNIFAIHFLSQEQMELVRTFGLFSGRKKNKFKNVPFTSKKTGCPIISGTIGYAECNVIEKIDVGDHTAIVGLIVNSEMGERREPLRVSHFMKHAPKTWLLRLALMTHKSRKDAEKLMNVYAQQRNI